MTPIHSLLALGLCAWALPAQATFRTAHPQSLPHINTGQMIPLSDHNTWGSGRSQLLIEARFLPGPGAELVGVEAFPLSGGKVHYQSLEIRVSPISPSAGRSAVFAANMPKPTSIFAKKGYDLTWSTLRWETFPAAGRYVHDGSSDLTLEIIKDTGPGWGNGASTGLHIPSSPSMLVSYGKAGSRASQATKAIYQVIPIDIRLVWRKAPTLRLASPIPKTGHHGFALGSYLDVQVEAEAFSLAVVWLDGVVRHPVQIPGVSGLLRVQGTRLPFPPVLTTQSASTRLPIPNWVNLDGLPLVFQGLTMSRSTNLLQLTNVAECKLSR